MVARLYLPSSGVAPVSPAYGSIWDSGPKERRPMAPTPQGTALATLNSSEANEVAAPLDTLARQYVSLPPLVAGEVSGTFSAAVWGFANTYADRMMLQLMIRVVSSDGTVERGTLYAGQTAVATTTTVGAINEAFKVSTQSPKARIFVNVPLIPVVAQAGDRLVVEIGGRITDTGGGNTVSLRFGDPLAAGDLALDSTLGTDSLRPWVEFSQDVFGSITEVGVGSNNFADATPLVIVGNGGTCHSALTNNTTYTTEAGEPAGISSSNLKSAWWKYTPLESGPVRLDTQRTEAISGGGFDTQVAVYTGAALNALTIVASNSDSGGGTDPYGFTPKTYSSRLSWNAVAGTTYWIQVGAFSSANMSYGLRVIGPTTAGAPPEGPALSWWDGAALQPVATAHWWDGAALQPVEVLGWWDGDSIEPLA